MMMITFFVKLFLLLLLAIIFSFFGAYFGVRGGLSLAWEFFGGGARRRFLGLKELNDSECYKRK